jgi:hypothetical protein
MKTISIDSLTEGMVYFYSQRIPDFKRIRRSGAHICIIIDEDGNMTGYKAVHISQKKSEFDRHKLPEKRALREIEKDPEVGNRTRQIAQALRNFSEVKRSEKSLDIIRLAKMGPEILAHLEENIRLGGFNCYAYAPVYGISHCLCARVKESVLSGQGIEHFFLLSQNETK